MRDSPSFVKEIRGSTKVAPCLLTKLILCLLLGYQKAPKRVSSDEIRRKEGAGSIVPASGHGRLYLV